MNFASFSGFHAYRHPLYQPLVHEDTLSTLLVIQFFSFCDFLELLQVYRTLVQERYFQNGNAIPENCGFSFYEIRFSFRICKLGIAAKIPGFQYYLEAFMSKNSTKADTPKFSSINTLISFDVGHW